MNLFFQSECRITSEKRASPDMEWGQLLQDPLLPHTPRVFHEEGPLCDVESLAKEKHRADRKTFNPDSVAGIHCVFFSVVTTVNSMEILMLFPFQAKFGYIEPET